MKMILNLITLIFFVLIKLEYKYNNLYQYGLTTNKNFHGTMFLT
jgi:hypothetical protein